VKRLKKEEKSQVYQFVSEELKNTQNDTSVRFIIQVIPQSCWRNFEESARLRTENKLIKSIKNGRYIDMEEKCISGGFGAWALKIINDFILKDELVDVLLTKLESTDSLEQDYVFRFFFSHFHKFPNSPTPRMIEIISKGLKEGDKRFYDLVEPLIAQSQSWAATFSELYEDFVEREPTPTVEDDIPF